MRREARAELPYPNWIYLRNLDAPLAVGTDPSSVVAEGNSYTYLSRLDSYSTANSFGVPSSPPIEWQTEIKKIRRLLPAGKLLIVSVMGTHEEYSGQEFVDDFVGVAMLAAEAGAPAIELNVSCPNKIGLDGRMMDPLCQDPQATREIVHSVRAALDAHGHRDVPLIARRSIRLQGWGWGGRILGCGR